MTSLRTGRIFPIGFHLGPGGNADGLGKDFMIPLDAAGIRFCVMAADMYPWDAAEIARKSGIQHTVIWRTTNLDVPINGYTGNPAEEADKHYDATKPLIPPELHKDLVHVGFLNEVDKNQADWLGWFCLQWSKRAMVDGYMPAGLGWSSGEPEKEHWLTPGMRAYLKFVSENRDRCLVMLHEYSYSTEDIWRQHPYLVGRWRLLKAACAEIGIPMVPWCATEWGWEYQTVPPLDKGLEDINGVAKEYVLERECYGGAGWYLGPGFGGIANLFQPYIKPVGDMALNWPHYIDWDDGSEPPTEPPTEPGDCILTDNNTRFHILRPKEMSTDQWNFLHKEMTVGRNIPGVGHVIFGYEGWTHTDAMDAIKKAVAKGFIMSRLVIMDGHQIGTGLDYEWMQANCPALLPYTVWIESEANVPGPFEFKIWPADGAPYVTQQFHANPQNYAQFGLPGHDGVDIRAPEWTKIFAVDDGEVYRIENNPNASNYGIHVRILHRDGWKTISAHFVKVADGLYLGKKVKAGELIGYSGNTGNSFGAHLHLGLKREGFTYTDEHGHVWPYNLHDPTPYLEKFCPPCFASSPPPASGHAMLGLHASADPGLAAGEASMFETAKIEMVKILSNLPPEHCSQLASKRPAAPFVIRVYQDGWNRSPTPQEFVEWNMADVVRYMPILDGHEVSIELHNEPNLVQEGWTYSWANGRQFADWLQPVISAFRARLPNSKLVFPGLSPGGDVAGIRYDSYRFVQEAAQAVAECDILGVHVYWQKDLWPMSRALEQLDAYRRLFPDKPIIITEASNNRATTSQEIKGVEYIEFVNELKRRLEVLGVTYFVASASNHEWDWNTGTGEVWVGTSIPSIVGGR